MLVDIARGQTFIHEGAPAEHLHILILGTAKLSKLLPDGRRQIIGFGYASSLLGLTTSEDIRSAPKRSGLSGYAAWRDKGYRPCSITAARWSNACWMLPSAT
ncbi:MAG: cyclic nucleotide-binding domain-containing protein [Acetobacteraceae bacterium]